MKYRRNSTRLKFHPLEIHSLAYLRWWKTAFTRVWSILLFTFTFIHSQQQGSFCRHLYHQQPRSLPVRVSRRQLQYRRRWKWRTTTEDTSSTFPVFFRTFPVFSPCFPVLFLYLSCTFLVFSPTFPVFSRNFRESFYFILSPTWQ